MADACGDISTDNFTRRSFQHRLHMFCMRTWLRCPEDYFCTKGWFSERICFACSNVYTTEVNPSLSKQCPQTTPVETVSTEGFLLNLTQSRLPPPTMQTLKQTCNVLGPFEVGAQELKVSPQGSPLMGQTWSQCTMWF